MQYKIIQVKTGGGFGRTIYIEAESDEHARQIFNDTKLDDDTGGAELLTADGDPVAHVTNYLSRIEAAAFSGKSKETIQRWVRSGALRPAGKVGGAFRFRRSDIIDILRGNTPQLTRRRSPKND